MTWIFFCFAPTSLLLAIKGLLHHNLITPSPCHESLLDRSLEQGAGIAKVGESNAMSNDQYVVIARSTRGIAASCSPHHISGATIHLINRQGVQLRLSSKQRQQLGS
jgi:hypothetical protein